MTYETVAYSAADGVGTVTLNRPDHLNGITNTMMREVHELLHEVAADDAVGVVVLTGAGRAFCPGADLAHYSSRRTPTRSCATSTSTSRCCCTRCRRSRSPPSTGPAPAPGSAGRAPATCATSPARPVSTRRSSTSPSPATWACRGRCPALGAGAARELSLLPRKLSADEAARDRARQRGVRRRSAARRGRAPGPGDWRPSAPLARRGLKAHYVAAEGMGFAEFVAVETERHREISSSADCREAFKAFIEKRPAHAFEGRADGDRCCELRQIALVARDRDAVVADLVAVLGLRVGYEDPHIGRLGLHNALLPVGTQLLEVVGPDRRGDHGRALPRAAWRRRWLHGHHPDRRPRGAPGAGRRARHPHRRAVRRRRVHEHAAAPARHRRLVPRDRRAGRRRRPARPVEPGRPGLAAGDQHRRRVGDHGRRDPVRRPRRRRRRGGPRSSRSSGRAIDGGADDRAGERRIALRARHRRSRRGARRHRPGHRRRRAGARARPRERGLPVHADHVIVGGIRQYLRDRVLPRLSGRRAPRGRAPSVPWRGPACRPAARRRWRRSARGRSRRARRTSACAPRRARRSAAS